MPNKTSKPKLQKIKIVEPILEKDYKAALALLQKTLFKGSDFTVDNLKRASFGELFVAKADDRVVGMLRMWRPGTAIQEYDEQYFHLETIKYPKKDLGYISLISVDPNYQGSGIGKKLVEKAIKQQKEWGTKVIIVHVSTSSPGGASEKLFTSFGFVFNYLHKQPWYEYSKREGQEGFSCIFCGNPCTCDELEMVLELLKTDYK